MRFFLQATCNGVNPFYTANNISQCFYGFCSYVMNIYSGLTTSLKKTKNSTSIIADIKLYEHDMLAFPTYLETANSSTCLQHWVVKWVPAKCQRCSAAGKITAGLAESNSSLPPGGLNACTLGSAPGPTLGNECGKPLPFLLSHIGIRLTGGEKQDIRRLREIRFHRRLMLQQNTDINRPKPWHWLHISNPATASPSSHCHNEQQHAEESDSPIISHTNTHTRTNRQCLLQKLTNSTCTHDNHTCK